MATDTDDAMSDLAKAEAALAMWTVYRSPRDYPGRFVARRFLIVSEGPVMTHDMFVADSLDEVRMLLPPGLCCLGRDESDDPVIAETWI